MPYRLLVDDRVLKELEDRQRYTAKVYRQITLKILSLQSDPRPQDYKPIGEGYRVDSGEYRIYYEVNDDEKLVIVYWIGKHGRQTCPSGISGWFQGCSPGLPMLP